MEKEFQFKFYDGLPAPDRRQPIIKVAGDWVTCTYFDLLQIGAVHKAIEINFMWKANIEFITTIGQHDIDLIIVCKDSEDAKAVAEAIFKEIVIRERDHSTRWKNIISEIFTDGVTQGTGNAERRTMVPLEELVNDCLQKYLPQ